MTFNIRNVGGVSKRFLLPRKSSLLHIRKKLQSHPQAIKREMVAMKIKPNRKATILKDFFPQNLRHAALTGAEVERNTHVTAAQPVAAVPSASVFLLQIPLVLVKWDSFSSTFIYFCIQYFFLLLFLCSTFYDEAL